MATAAGLTSTLLAVGLTNQAFTLSNPPPQDDAGQELAASMVIELFET